MTLPRLDQFLRTGAARLAQGPLALILAEDGTELASTVAHHVRAGFGTVLLLLPPGLDAPAEMDAAVIALRHDTRPPGATEAAVNAVIDAAPPDGWLYYGYNAEYLFHPFCESRSVAEMLAFHAEERRTAMLTYVIDLYPADLAAHPDGVDRAGAMLDRCGYYALARRGADGRPLERQFDFFGGLRWRFDDHVPAGQRRIDRIALFRTRPGLRLLPGHLLNVAEMNTYACPWHHNLTACILSFRAAKALCTNPGSRYDIGRMTWTGSEPCQWSSRQLMDLGLMEPGQWF